MPVRLQRKRTKGYRLPSDAVYVGRPTRWGNPFVVGQRTHLWHRAAAFPFDFYRDWFTVGRTDQAVTLYRRVLLAPGEYWLDQPNLPTLVDIHRGLNGRDLACWCPLDQPCHADVLLEIAATRPVPFESDKTANEENTP